MVISRYYRVELVQADCLSDTERGESGFGSTGVAVCAEAFGLDARTLTEVV
jgi:hypothetical protein